ncbi:ribose-phosphate diphosphokinase [Desulfosarcina ovata]|uniref:ribose-phosphate diphosphokinase n=2 Tax=Desulfosarcina ovata TaxID=83564 RepID=A0A5K8AF60_9BACT|nr:ribose-phosphate pyrophosphokinase [Desulfosarcina ovata]BBO84708.1 ribose-phosphate pyrophosphokinase [Desulfosarcina ovata subsp. sediminis]BBO91201.1 ribose-phosphate pyrophosphokinase [Desulfosarcina ovata subsp. ovata]
MSTDLKVFSGSANPKLAESICQFLGISLSQMEVSRFSNDNLFVQIQENVREKDVFVVQPFTAPVGDTIMELFIILDALRSASARRITAVIPYFSYARSDKKDAPRISIAGRLMADLIKTAGANRVLTMDLHSDAVHGFFSVPVDHLTAVPYFVEHFRRQLDLDNAVVVATDAGGAKRAGRFAKRIHLPMAIIDKRRIADTKVVQGLVVGDVKGRDAIIFEDEISTGGTLAESVKTLTNAGVNSIHVGATHGVLCGPAVERLVNSDMASVVVTNTVYLPPDKQREKIHTLSVAPLFAEAIRRIHTGESVGALFD